MYNMPEHPLTREELKRRLEAVDGAKICLIGDFCLDIYWHADMRLSELSRETPHYPLPIVEERFSPGGAGNVACNIAALRPGSLRVVGAAGTDWRGDLLLRALAEHGIGVDGIVRRDGIVTNTYIKPVRRGISDVAYEDPRLDFENRAPLPEDCERAVLDALERAAADADVICVSDQMRFGCVTPAVRERLCRYGEEGRTVVVDSRDRMAQYRCAVVKPNEVEASRAFGDGSAMDMDGLSELAAKISLRNNRLALVTLGAQGCFAAENGAVTRCPACAVEPPIDFCGAGDTFLSGFASLLAGGAPPLQAVQGANLCSAVTIRKIGTTGTATREEVLRAWDEFCAPKI